MCIGALELLAGFFRHPHRAVPWGQRACRFEEAERQRTSVAVNAHGVERAGPGQPPPRGQKDAPQREAQRIDLDRVDPPQHEPRLLIVAAGAGRARTERVKKSQPDERSGRGQRVVDAQVLELDADLRLHGDELGPTCK